MNPADKNHPAAAHTDDSIDFSDLLGAGQAFPADRNASVGTSAPDALIDAHCNKIGNESCC